MNNKSLKINSHKIIDLPYAIPLAVPAQTNSHISLPPISSFDNLIFTTTISSRSSSPSTASFTTSIYENHNNLLDSNNYTNSAPPLSNLLNSKNSSTVASPEISVSEASKDHIIIPELKEIKSKGRFTEKKECPKCKKFFANLHTHQSTHLSPKNRPHKCPQCKRGFSRSNDLIRHKKRHWKDKLISIENSGNEPIDAESSIRQKNLKNEQLISLYQMKSAYKCPFNSTLIELDTNIHHNEKDKSIPLEIYNCHPTGVFSRCDTYKNHLKALHFEYPPKTRKQERSIVSGKCKHCHKEFENVDTWLKVHVNKGCGYNYKSITNK